MTIQSEPKPRIPREIRNVVERFYKQQGGPMPLKVRKAMEEGK